jgi:hypothetical protein
MTTWKDSLERRDEVKAAYLEGLELGMDMSVLDDEREAAVKECWETSEARARLEKPLA